MTMFFNFVLSLKRWFQFNSTIVRTLLASVMTLNLFLEDILAVVNVIFA